MEKYVQAHNEAVKRKALGHPGIDPRLAAKKKKPTKVEAEAPRQDRPKIVFPGSMTGLKPKVPSTAFERKRTKQAEAEAKKRKHQEASDAVPCQKRLKTKPSKASIRAQAPTASSAPEELLLVEPISIA